jgi:hypothetical protein
MGKYAKGISAFVAAILAVGVSVLVPGISAELAASLTGVLTVLATVFGPKNADDTPTYPTN